MWHKVYTERSRSGFTLIELLVVVSILSLLGLVSYANLRNFRSAQVIEKAASDLQSLLRLAQSNATARLNCNGQAGATWLVEFSADRQTISLRCYVDDPLSATTQGNPLSFSGTNIQVNTIQGRGSATCTTSFPTYMIDIRFAPLYGTVSLIDLNPTGTCLNSANTTEAAITLRDTQRNTTRVVVVKKGGGINVEDSTSPTPTPPPPTPTPTPSPIYVDNDLDGFGAGPAVSPCPAGKTCVSNNSDCYDLNNNAKPGQTAYFTTTRGTSALGNDSAGNTWNSFDYDCSGTKTFEHPYRSDTTICQPNTNSDPDGFCGYTSVYNCSSNLRWCFYDNSSCTGTQFTTVGCR